MKIEINPAEVEILDRPGMNEIHAWAMWRGHEFQFCSMGWSRGAFQEFSALKDRMRQMAAIVAAEQLKQDIAAMSNHARLQFLAATRKPD